MTTRKTILSLITALVVLIQIPSTSAAQSIGTIVVAHGGDSTWNALVRHTAAALGLAGPVEVSFLMGPEAQATRFQDVATRLAQKGVREIVVVPLLVSSHSGHYEQVRYLAGQTDSLDAVMREHLHHGGIERARVDIPIRVAAALDDSYELAQVLTDRAKAHGVDPASHALMLVGHGPNSAEDYAAWMRNLRVVADSVRHWSGFSDVRVELVREDAPAPVRAEAIARLRELIAMQAELTGKPVVVVPILISKGGISRSRLMKDLEQLPIRYADEPLLPHPAMAAWIARRSKQVH